MHHRDNPCADHDPDVLIVGAGPTGLVLAAQLRRFGTRFRLIDSASDGVHESRALAVQARSLEILQTLGLADALVRRGNRSARLMIHFDSDKTAEVELGGFGRTDTRFPFILFVSQAETERLLGEHLAAQGVTIERGVRFVGAAIDAATACSTLGRADGTEEQVRTRFLVGCDGAHSAVRKAAGIPFEGDAYLQSFALGDVEVDGPLRPDTLHAFPGAGGVAMFFPLGAPSTWRVIASSVGDAKGDSTGRHPRQAEITQRELSLPELQEIVDVSTGGSLRLTQPAWLARFRLHHRQAKHYRNGSVFLAGDAAHVHSPVGAQGMNTGIQDAWNLGWKLALVSAGAANASLLDSYEAERWPVGRVLLRYTDRAFSLFLRSMSASRFAALMRRRVAPCIAPTVLRFTRVREAAFHFISELGIRYRGSSAVEEGVPRLGQGPMAGDRLPDLKLMRDGEPVFLHDALASPHLHLLLCGPLEAWEPERLSLFWRRHERLVRVHRLACVETPHGLFDPDGHALRMLGVDGGSAAQYLVRPDGHVAFRCEGRDLRLVEHFMSRRFGGGADTLPRDAERRADA